MRFVRFVPCVVIAAAFAVACGKDSNGPSARVSSVTGVAGDGQIGTLGTQLAFALSFTVLDSVGHPIRGLAVPWTVSPTGAATFTPATSTSDADGLVATTVRLGADTGVLTVSANVPNFAPVVFHVLSLDPCRFGVDLALPSTANGALATTDCFRGGWYYDYYLLDTPAGQSNVRLTMSATFDTWIDFYSGADGAYTGFDDDVARGTNTNSQLDLVLPQASWVIGANSYDPGSTGAYIVGAALRPSALNGCREVWFVDGVSVTDTLKASDCADSSGTAHYYEVARVWADPGTVLTLAVHSAALNPRMSLYRLETNYTRTLIATNDDSTGGFTNSFIVDTVTTTAPYDVIIGTSGIGETGAYTFSASVVAPAPVARAMPAARWDAALRARALTAARLELPHWPKPLPIGGRRH